MKFKVGDEVKVVRATDKIIDEFVGKTGVIVGLDTWSNGEINSTDPYKISFDGITESCGYLFNDDELELVKSHTDDGAKGCQSLYLVSEYNDIHKERIVVDIGTKDRVMEILKDSYDINEEYQVYKLVPAFRVRLEKTAKVIEED